MSKRSEAVGRWRGIVREQALSGLSAAAFCRQSQISQASFYAWRRRLRNAANNTGQETSKFAERDAANFAEVRIAAAPAEDAGAAGDAADFSEECVSPDSNPAADALELILSHGHRIVVRPGFDCQTLLNLLATLERYAADVRMRERHADVTMRQRNPTRPASCRTRRGIADVASPEAGA